MLGRNVLFVLRVGVVIGCAVSAAATSWAQAPVRPIDRGSLPRTPVDGEVAALRTAAERQLTKCRAMEQGTTWQFGRRRTTRAEWCTQTAARVLEIARTAENIEELTREVIQSMQWFKSDGRPSDNAAFFTGYHVPQLEAKRDRDETFRHPVYARPADLRQVVINGARVWRRVLANGRYEMFPSRRDIDWGGALETRGLEIGYVADPLDVFFLHVQGAGILRYLDEEETSERFVNYAAENGHSYVAIGRVLRDEGVEPRYYQSLPGLRRYFAERPAEIARVLPLNPSYVFFHESESGPLGVENTILTPLHVIAADLRLYPFGSFGLIQSVKPVLQDGEIVAWEPYRRLVFVHDTGGAIRGPGRVDVFWGSDAYAETAAGNTHHTGELYFALPPSRGEGKVKRQPLSTL